MKIRFGEENEIWKSIPGYSNYEASNIGNIRKIGGKGKLKLSNEAHGYLKVNIVGDDGTRHTQGVHRLVALAFVPNPDNLPEVNHKNENKKDNCVGNLEWCSSDYNRSYGTGISRAGVHRRRAVVAIEEQSGRVLVFESVTAASVATGVREASIHECLSGRNGMKHAGGYKWMGKKEYDRDKCLMDNGNIPYIGFTEDLYRRKEKNEKPEGAPLTTFCPFIVGVEK